MLDLALAIPRIVVGLILAGHGSQKLFGWFGGHRLAGTAGFFASTGVRWAKPLALLVGLAELLGGLGLAFGLATPVAAAAVSVVMLGAVVLAHWPRLWVTNGGFEYPLVNLAVAAQFGLYGPGAYALDPWLGLSRYLPLPQAYLAGLAVAVLIVLAVVATRKVASQGAQPATSAA